MSALWESDLRIALATPLLLLGLWLSVTAIRSTVTAFRMAAMATDKNLRIMRGFRSAIVGTGLALVAAGWVWQIEALVIAASLIGAGELFETSLNVAALRRETLRHLAAQGPHRRVSSSR
jgi:hypothetical protein